jgi:PAS domain S-box
MLRRRYILSKIALIAPFPNLAELALKVCEGLNENIDVRIGDMEKGVNEAKAAIDNGAQIVISRGGTAIAIRQRLNIPVVEVVVSGYDLMRAINYAKRFSSKIGVVGFKNIVYGVSTLKELMDIDITELVVNSNEDMEKVMADIDDKGIEMIVGDAIAVRVASAHGLLTALVNSGKESIAQAIKEAHQALEILENERARTEEIKTIISYVRDGIVALDESGRVKLINQRAEKILRVSAADVVGHKAAEKIPGLLMDKVIKNGLPVLEEVNHTSSGIIVQNIVPLINQGKVIGAVSTFQEASKLQKAEEKVRRELYLKGNKAYYTFNNIDTKNEKMMRLIDQAKKFAPVDSTVLINGESGTGKEILAQSIHNASLRCREPFVAINCAALPETLLESELFGYEEGAFTGAKKGGKVGLFEMAHKGTLFLDEVGDLPLSLQARLLRVLQEKVVRRLGGDKVIPVDVRIVAATNKNLLDEIKKGSFRGDLFYRLNVLFLNLPNLKERICDIPLLSNIFVKKTAKKLGCMEAKISDEVIDEMQRYSWPGNIRELENLIERLSVIKCGEMITAGDLPWKSSMDLEANNKNYTVKTSIEDTERDVILDGLNSTGWNLRRASELLGISKTTLWRKMKKYGFNSETVSSYTK